MTYLGDLQFLCFPDYTYVHTLDGARDYVT